METYIYSHPPQLCSAEPGAKCVFITTEQLRQYVFTMTLSWVLNLNRSEWNMCAALSISSPEMWRRVFDQILRLVYWLCDQTQNFYHILIRQSFLLFTDAISPLSYLFQQKNMLICSKITYQNQIALLLLPKLWVHWSIGKKQFNQSSYLDDWSNFSSEIAKLFRFLLLKYEDMLLFNLVFRLLIR